MRKDIRLATIGIRSIPPRDGCAGSDTVCYEYTKRLAKVGIRQTIYNRLYNDEKPLDEGLPEVDFVYHKTVNKMGFDTLVHSAKATFHVIYHNTADIVVIGNGGSSIFGLLLRLFGKKVIVWVDGIDWRREKWPWYAKVFLYLSSYITATVPDHVIFDNIYGRQEFENRFHKKFECIPNGVDVGFFRENRKILDALGLSPGDYILFVGRFVPEKGLHYLVKAFEQVKTSKRMVLVGGSPNPSEYESNLLKNRDERILTPGYIYGDDYYTLVKNAYLYVQPSDVEGLSPVIQQVMAIGTPLLCSDIPPNVYIVKDYALTFKKGDVGDLKRQLEYSLENPDAIRDLSRRGRDHVEKEFNWEVSIGKFMDLLKRISGNERLS